LSFHFEEKLMILSSIVGRCEKGHNKIKAKVKKAIGNYKLQSVINQIYG
jgi:hypothetical protein